MWRKCERAEWRLARAAMRRIPVRLLPSELEQKKTYEIDRMTPYLFSNRVV